MGQGILNSIVTCLAQEDCNFAPALRGKWQMTSLVLPEGKRKRRKERNQDCNAFDGQQILPDPMQV